MAKAPKYRLQPILEEKERNREAAVHFLNKKKAELATEEQKLEAVKEELRNTIARKDQMVEDYNTNMFNGQYTVDEIKIRKLHIEDMNFKIEEIKKAVEKQRKNVERANGEVLKAEDALIAASKEVQVMEKHKENWIKALQDEERKKEARELEEIAQTMYNSSMANRSRDDM